MKCRRIIAMEDFNFTGGYGERFSVRIIDLPITLEKSSGDT